MEHLRRQRLGELFAKLSDVLGCGPTDKVSVLQTAVTRLESLLAAANSPLASTTAHGLQRTPNKNGGARVGPWQSLFDCKENRFRSHDPEFVRHFGDDGGGVGVAQVQARFVPGSFSDFSGAMRDCAATGKPHSVEVTLSSTPARRLRVDMSAVVNGTKDAHWVCVLWTPVEGK